MVMCLKLLHYFLFFIMSNTHITVPNGPTYKLLRPFLPLHDRVLFF